MSSRLVDGYLRKLAKFYQIFPVFPMKKLLFFWIVQRNLLASGKLVPKTNLAVISMEYCGCLHCEGDIRMRLGGGSPITG
jgi:hypothetical protein